MEVLMQDWQTPKGTQTSISLNEEHLRRTVEELKAQGNGEKPFEEPKRASIEDDSGLAGMVVSGTVFLCEDEWELITVLCE
ncbi:hypothetical protein KTR10_03405 [Candidatus Kaiserbacteria bacterium]|nr:hypothetical protein [Candidatus Kaiserbacteria bacterium]